MKNLCLRIRYSFYPQTNESIPLQLLSRNFLHQRVIDEFSILLCSCQIGMGAIGISQPGLLLAKGYQSMIWKLERVRANSAKY